MFRSKEKESSACLPKIFESLKLLADTRTLVASISLSKCYRESHRASSRPLRASTGGRRHEPNPITSMASSPSRISSCMSTAESRANSRARDNCRRVALLIGHRQGYVKTTLCRRNWRGTPCRSQRCRRANCTRTRHTLALAHELEAAMISSAQAVPECE